MTHKDSRVTITTPSGANLDSQDTGGEVQELFDTIGANTFEHFRVIREQQRNSEEGYENRNNPTYQQDPTVFSPSQLGKCHRWSCYDMHNTPNEERQPHGLFEIGHHFETLIEAYANWISPPRWTVKNPVHIEYEAENGHTITGSTDPIIFNDKNEPCVHFEVKTIADLHYVKDNPKPSHRDQAFAYARGLTKKFNLDEPLDIVFAYISRKSMETAFHTISFDSEHWQSEVLKWMDLNATYREINYENPEDLPPKLAHDDDRAYQCKEGFCPHRGRCGKANPNSKRPSEAWREHDGDGKPHIDHEWYKDTIATHFQSEFEDQMSIGLMPTQLYPESELISHLLTYPDVKLTPTVAHQHPNLIVGNQPSDRIKALYGECPQRAVHDWHCPNCRTQIPYDDVDWDGDFKSLPCCPHCDFDEPMRGPTPNEVGL